MSADHPVRFLREFVDQLDLPALGVHHAGRGCRSATRQETDAGQLVPLPQQARENLGVAAHATGTVADRGYGAGTDLLAAADVGLAVLAPPAEGTPTQANPYAAQHFRYYATAQTVTCSQGRVLDHEGHTTKRGSVRRTLPSHCRDCPTRAPNGRQVEVWPHTVVVQAMRARRQNPAVHAQWSQRGEIIERRFGQIKRHDGFRRWTVRGLAAGQTQWALLCTTLNLHVLYQRGLTGQAGDWGGAAAVAIRHTLAA